MWPPVDVCRCSVLLMTQWWYINYFLFQKGGLVDDSMATYVKFQCRGFSQALGYVQDLQVGHAQFGTFGSWSEQCAQNSAICGMSVKNEPYQGAGDDSAVNDVNFHCCGF